MAALSDYVADAVRDLILRNTAFSPPWPIYLALFTSATTEAGGGTEVVGGSYARPAITFTAPSTGLAVQAADITITGMPACTVVAAAVMDDPTAGNMLIHGRLPRARIIAAGGDFFLPAGDLRQLFD